MTPPSSTASAGHDPAPTPGPTRLGPAAHGAARQGVAPLAPEDLARADRVARRLHAAITGLLDALPESARNASGLARHLRVDRTSCQRAVFAVSRPCSGAELFTALPGVRGLRQIAEAAAALRPAPDRAARDALAAALTQYEELLGSLGGSQSRLLRRLERSAAGAAGHAGVAHSAGGDATREARIQLFEAAAELTGRHSDCWVAAYVYAPDASDPHKLDVGRAHGLVGHVARKDAVPLVVHNFATRPEQAATDAPGAFTGLGRASTPDGSPDPVLREFTTDPPPLVTSKQPTEFLVQAIDEREPAFGRPVDLLLATSTSIPHPVLQAHAVEEAWALVNFPCRHLLFDIWLHRDLARACIPALDTHLWRPDFAQQSGDRWQTRFSDSPTLQLLGSGPRRVPPAAWPRMTELTATLFERMGRDPADYVGFRCDVAYPVWRAGYCVSFDFTAPQPEDRTAGD